VRILLDYRPALRQRTGVGEYVHELTRALLAAEVHPPDVITVFSASMRDRLDGSDLPGAVIADLPVPVRALNYAWHRWQWPPVETLTRFDYDVVHAAHPIRIPSRRAAQVVTVHDLDFLRHPERTRAEIRRDYPALAPAHIRAADAVLAVSATTARDIESLTGHPASRVIVAPLGRPDWPHRREEPADGVILFFGTIEPRKNVDSLLDAYAWLIAQRDAAGRATPPLVLAGSAGGGADALLARTRQAPLLGRVEVLGYVDPDVRLDTYRRAIALVMPSHAEGFGLPAHEAMTVGVPVIAADAGALPEVLGGAGALYPPGDVDALCATLNTMIDDEVRRDHMRAAGWQRALDFSWAHTAERTREAWQLARAAAHERHRG